MNVLARNDGRNPNLFVFLTSQHDSSGNVGISWLGVVCEGDKGYRTSISEYYKNDLDTAEVSIFESFKIFMQQNAVSKKSGV